CAGPGRPKSTTVSFWLTLVVRFHVIKAHYAGPVANPHWGADVNTAWLAAALALAASAATAQNRTTEIHARSYIQSAFITGAAHAILADDVVLGRELRERLALPADAH